MPRIAGSVFAGVPHHITQRGNRREDVFMSKSIIKPNLNG
jgi:hypothetical protein